MGKRLDFFWFWVYDNIEVLLTVEKK